MKYSFYAKNTFNKEKEPINSVEAADKVKAVNYFATIKNLPLDKFCNLYEVIKAEH
jgi:hypothetical protein